VGEIRPKVSALTAERTKADAPVGPSALAHLRRSERH
jgi:hypothetical protein